MPKSGFPGGSKSRVNHAGDAIRAGHATEEDLKVIETWRAAHAAVINTFQALLRNRAKEWGVKVIQRHKRKATIFDKLLREPKLELARMDDVAGCRLIFPDIGMLYAFRAQLHEARFEHELKNQPDKYDYIKRPKADGYRGVHDVYEYNVASEEGRHLRGLRIEIQYRTEVQNAWATTNEIIGHVTHGASEPKFHRGDRRYEDAMRLASEVLARAHEGGTGPLPGLSDAELVDQLAKADAELKLFVQLKQLKVLIQASSSRRELEYILMREGPQLQLLEFETPDEAMTKLFALESERPGADVVYVPGSTSEQIRSAYKNYYDDAAEFLERLETGRLRLLSKGKG